MINKYCKICKHRIAPKFLREFYNKENKFNFFNTEECLIEDDLAGCTLFFKDINWEGYLNKYLKRHPLTEENIEILEKLGWKLNKK